MEYLEKGPLITLLQQAEDDYDPNWISVPEMLGIAIDAAGGLVYLHGQQLIHADFALRNLLVSSFDPLTVKVSDFGMSKFLELGEDYYYGEVGGGTPIPIRWSSPEVLTKLKFSTAADVWSFGVCMWEIFSRGEVPFFSMNNAEVAQHVYDGGRLSRPAECSPDMWIVAESCFQEKTKDRPTMSQILDIPLDWTAQTQTRWRLRRFPPGED